MKIVSSFKDYYDYALVWTDDDERLVYQRETLHLPIPTNEYKIKETNFPAYKQCSDYLGVEGFSLLFFCGKRHVLMYYTDHRQEIPAIQVAYNEAITPLLKEAKNKGKKQFFGNLYQIQHLMNKLLAVPDNAFEYIYQTYYTPVFAVNHQGITINPYLKNYHFQEILEGHQAFQAIEQFLFGVLIVPEKPTVEISNQDKIMKHGFDTKWSFRREPKDGKSE